MIAGLLTTHGQTLSAAESCTGGLLAKQATDRPGASEWFNGGVVSYSNRAKAELLGVKPELIELHGAVSEEVALALAHGAIRSCRSNWGVAITGIAGPSGGSEEKPVGTVYIAVAGAGSQAVRRYQFGGDRGQIRQRSVIKAAELLWRSLLAGRPVTEP